jgi:hypothetical protein
VAPSPSSAQEDVKQIDLIINKDVDVLFIIDNSGSMGEEQGLLAKNFPEFVNVLSADDVKANYRMAVATTDMAPAICQASGDSSTEGSKKGEMSLTSCETRRSMFTKQLPSDAEDYRYNTACDTPCEVDAEDLEIIPTELQEENDIEQDGEKPRQWLQSVEGRTNLPEGVSPDKAFQCFAPQGIKGCGLEQPLEALHAAIALSKKKGSPNYGFFREKAITAFVIVTDELDCSYNPDIGDKVFDKNQSTSENEAIWPAADPDVYAANVACLNAGADCTKSGGEFECEPANFNIKREKVTDPDKSILYPVEKYIDEIQAIEDEKNDKVDTIKQEVIVALIAGVEVSAAGQSTQPTYPVASDPEHIHKFGEVGFGCGGTSEVEEEEGPSGTTFPAGSVMQTAMPPVRLKRFTEAFQEDPEADSGMYSICAKDYAAPLRKIAEQIRSQIKPACYKGCVKDTEPDTKMLDPNCDVQETRPGQTAESVVECVKDENGYVMDEDNNYTLPGNKEEGPHVCYAYRWDTDGTSDDPNDDIDSECSDNNNNLEFKLQRRAEHPAPANTTVKATCQLSDNAAEDCPSDYDDATAI